MKKIFLFVFCISIIFSCGEEDPETYAVDTLSDVETGNEYMLIDRTNSNITYDGTVLSGVQDLSVIVGMAASPKSAAVGYTYEVVDSLTSAVEGQQYMVSGSSGMIPAGSLKSNIPITVDLDQMDLSVPYTIGVKLASSDLPDFDKGVAVITFTKICPSTLAGTYEAMTTVVNVNAGIGWDDCEGSTWEGTVILESPSVAQYIVRTVNQPDSLWNDPSFGAYYACYGTTAEGNLANGPMGSTGDVGFGDVCGKLAFAGASQWGEVYEFTRVEVSADGITLIIGWQNDYGEAGETRIVNPETWPPDLRF